MGFSHAEEKAIVEGEPVLYMDSDMFIHRLMCSFSGFSFFFFPDNLNLNIAYWKFHMILVNS